jgi:hypothetical protein
MKIFAAGIEYDDLIRAMRDRRMQLGLSQTDVDQLAGVPGGYYAKCETMLTNPAAKNARSIGRDSLPKLLGALGLRFAVIAETEFQAEKIKGLGLKAKLSGENADIIQRLPPNRILSERGKKGGLKRWATMTPEQRQQFLDAGAAARRARRPEKTEPEPPAPVAAPLPSLVLTRRARPKPLPLTKRQAAMLRKKLVAERATLQSARR